MGRKIIGIGIDWAEIGAHTSVKQPSADKSQIIYIFFIF